MQASKQMQEGTRVGNAGRSAYMLLQVQARQTRSQLLQAWQPGSAWELALLQGWGLGFLWVLAWVPG